MLTNVSFHDLPLSHDSADHDHHGANQSITTELLNSSWSELFHQLTTYHEATCLLLRAMAELAVAWLPHVVEAAAAMARGVHGEVILLHDRASHFGALWNTLLAPC